MRLYSNGRGEWVGTQAETRKSKFKFEQVEVPTDKKGLLEFLNNQKLPVDDPAQTNDDNKLTPLEVPEAPEIAIPQWKQDWLDRELAAKAWEAKQNANKRETQAEVLMEEFLYNVPMNKLNNLASIIIDRVFAETEIKSNRGKKK
tara:strand:+ start:6982 stop:7416 length:435 start_codon:yes stop_codon:yes gene_type:complete